MDNVKVFGDVRFLANAPMIRYEPDDWVLHIKGKISGMIEQNGETVKEKEDVGKLRAWVIMTTQAMNDGVRLADVCDAHSDLLFAVYRAIFEEDDDTWAQLNIEPSWDGFLYLHSIDVRPEYRDSGVVIQALETVIRCFCPGGIVAAYGNQLGLTVEEWRQLAFKKIVDSEVVFRDNTHRNPYGLGIPKAD